MFSQLGTGNSHFLDSPFVRLTRVLTRATGSLGGLLSGAPRTSMGGSNRAVVADFGNFRRPTAPGVKREAEEDWSR